MPGVHDNALAFWRIYPQFLRDLFTRAFTNGLHHPASRIRESEWRMGCVRLRDSIFYCPYCSLENFYDSDKLKATGQPGLCWSCATELQLPPRIRIGKNTVMLNYDTRSRKWLKVLETDYWLNCVSVDKDENIWVSCKNGLWLIDKSFTKKTFLPTLQLVDGRELNNEVSTLFFRF